MGLVAGIDSSTQSVKVVVLDAATGQIVRSGRAPHPDGTEVHPGVWWQALQSAIADAGGLSDVAAAAVGGQQHGMVVLDAAGEVIRPALLWNDTRSADAATTLIDELGGQAAWADAIGSVPVASLTVTKLRWLRDAEPDNAARVAAVCLPHDYLTWRLAGHGPKSEGGDAALDALVTDRGDASGTGYWSPASEDYRLDLLEMGLGKTALLPRVLGPADQAGLTKDGVALAPGSGDNAAAALGLGLAAGDMAVSVGTSGVVSAISVTPTADSSGLVAGFADATGHFLPLACTLNGARILDATATMLGVDHDGMDQLALAAPSGAGGLVLVPFFEGERTPNKPNAAAAFHGLRLANAKPTHVARAAVEGLCCLLADGMDAMTAQGVVVERGYLIGGGAASEAVRQIAPTVFGFPITVPPAGEYVAEGAGRQAA
ncbi:MAG: FGGY family carbohydrate kinase, partial [Micrococcales bacterium]|nr:FGGY family carbohydrate kinase [Micrococcales bacterium]